MNPRLRLLLAATAAVIGVLMWPHAFAPIWGTPLERTLWVGVAWALIAGGLVTWSRRPENATGRALTLTGFAFWMPVLIGVRIPVLWTLGSTMETLFVPLLFYTLLVFPDGRLRSRAERGLVAYAGANFVWSLWGAFFYDPSDLGCPDCQPGLNLLVRRSDPELVDFANRINGLLLIVGLTSLGVVLGRRWLRATKPARRVLAPMLVPAAVWVLSYLAYLGFQQGARHNIYEPPETVYRTLATSLLVSLLVLPVTFLVGLSRYRARRARVSDLVVELGRVRVPERLRDVLARTLGDPSLEVGFWVPDAGHYIAADGAEVAVAHTDSSRTATFLASEGQPLAVIVHDAALLDDPGLVDAVAAAARLAVENERLQTAVRAQLEEVRASRRRIVEVGDDARRRIERDLHDGAQARLLALSLALQVAQSKLDSSDDEARRSLDAAATELRAALGDLRDLARGIHPAVLTDEGLAAALDALVERMPPRVVLKEAPSDRLAANVEAAAYYVVAEALTNATKHARATLVTVRASKHDGELVVEVEDDGVGGASLGGGGLRGLADRVHALDGILEVESRSTGGTSVRARIPCG